MNTFKENNLLSLIGLLLALVLVCNSCKKKQDTVNYVQVVPDFLINNQQVANYGTDYDATELSENLNDSTKVLKVDVGQPVRFKNITSNDTSSISVEWRIDDELWKNFSSSKDQPSEFTFTFENSRFYKISLIYGGYSATHKIIQVQSANEETNKVIETNFAGQITKEQGKTKATYPSKLNIELLFSRMYESSISKAEQEAVFNSYQDSLNHFISAKTVISEDGIKTDFYDLIVMSMVTGDRLRLVEEPIYDNGKISYMALIKEN